MTGSDNKASFAFGGALVLVGAVFAWGWPGLLIVVGGVLMAGAALEAIGREIRRHRAVRRCRVCRCTDEHACPGGCWWVEWDLCSSCIDHAGKGTKR